MGGGGGRVGVDMRKKHGGREREREREQYLRGEKNSGKGGGVGGGVLDLTTDNEEQWQE